MEIDHRSAAEIAQRYFGTTSPPTRLGWGIGGFVYLSPKLDTAVKVHRREEGFLCELEVYRRLREKKITQLHGLNIPRLRDFRVDLRLIQMDFVSSPFLVDFAGVRFSPPDFPAETMQLWHAGISEIYGPNAHIAYAVYRSLARHGIYYMDFRPSNMKLDGLPGLEPFSPAEDDD